MAAAPALHRWGSSEGAQRLCLLWTQGSCRCAECRKGQIELEGTSGNHLVQHVHVKTAASPCCCRSGWQAVCTASACHGCSRLFASKELLCLIHLLQGFGGSAQVSECFT